MRERVPKGLGLCEVMVKAGIDSRGENIEMLYEFVLRSSGKISTHASVERLWHAFTRGENISLSLADEEGELLSVEKMSVLQA